MKVKQVLKTLGLTSVISISAFNLVSCDEETPGQAGSLVAAPQTLNGVAMKFTDDSDGDVGVATFDAATYMMTYQNGDVFEAGSSYSYTGGPGETGVITAAALDNSGTNIVHTLTFLTSTSGTSIDSENDTYVFEIVTLPSVPQTLVGETMKMTDSSDGDVSLVTFAQSSYVVAYTDGSPDENGPAYTYTTGLGNTGIISGTLPDNSGSPFEFKLTYLTSTSGTGNDQAGDRFTFEIQ